jgi:tetratricopeptide (TPR) repeat protein
MTVLIAIMMLSSVFARTVDLSVPIVSESDVLLHAHRQDEQIRAGHRDQTIKEYRDMHRSHPDSGYHTYLYARVCSNSTLKIQLLKEAVDQTPKLFHGRRDLARVFYSTGDYRGTIEQLTAALQTHPTSVQALYLRGLAYYHHGEVTEAIGDFRSAVSSDPDHLSSYEELSVALLHGGQSEDAVSVMNRMLERFGEAENRHQTYRNLGIAYARLGKMDESRLAYYRAVRERPDYFEGFISLGKAWYADDDLAKAALYFEKATTLHPGSAPALLQLGIVRFEQDRLDAARSLIRRALDLDSTLVGAHLYLSKVYREKGDYQRANDHLRRHHTSR